MDLDRLPANYVHPAGGRYCPRLASATCLTVCAYWQCISVSYFASNSPNSDHHNMPELAMQHWCMACGAWPCVIADKLPQI